MQPLLTRDAMPIAENIHISEEASRLKAEADRQKLKIKELTEKVLVK